MQTNQNFFVPEYIQDFKCIGKDCIDSCCVGWDIKIDKSTFNKYKNSTNKEIKSICQKSLVKDDLKSNFSYGKLVNENNCCPFLTKEKLCNAFKLMGQESLSIGCSTYPRKITIFDKIGFISGSLSCPEIARLCLSKRDLNIKTLKKKKLPNIFNSHNVFSHQVKKKLSDKKLRFIEEIFSKINDYSTIFETLKQTIISYDKINRSESSINDFLKKENEKIKKKLLHSDTNILTKLCFSRLVDSNKSRNQSSSGLADNKGEVRDSRFRNICKISAFKSDYLFSPKTTFVKQFTYIYNTKFQKFRKENDFIFKNYFINEFLKNIDSIMNSKDSLNNFIRNIILFITLTDFLLVCQLFEDNKKLTINSYVEVLSAVLKSINHSSKATHDLINLFRKLDKNNLSNRLVALY